MNSDQKMVAYIGLVLILLVLWGAYRKTITAILFSGNQSGDPNAGTPISPLTGITQFAEHPGVSTGANAGLSFITNNPITAPFTGGLSGQTFPINKAPKNIGPGISLPF